MGSDYLPKTVARWETINGVRVPVDENDHFLDWEEVSPDGKTARKLTSPYGSLEYAVGGEDDSGDWMMCFDFAVLPDGRYVLDSVVNTDSGGYIGGVSYYVLDASEAIAVAMGMVDEAIEGLLENGLEHDAEGWNQSACYFWRSVAASVQGNDSPPRFPDGAEQ